MPHRSIGHALLYTKENQLDLTWLLVSVITGCIVLGVVCECLGHHISVAAWSVLGTVFTSALIAAIPVNKARILASSTAVGDVAKGVATAANDIVAADPTGKLAIQHALSDMSGSL